MKVILTLLSAMLCLGAASAEACGDKFLVRCIVNTAGISQTVASVGILIYNDGSPPMRHLTEVGLAERLAGEGHKVYVVRSREELLELLVDTRVDLAIVDWHAAGAMRDALGADPLFLCTVDESEKKMVPELRKKYAPLLKVPESSITTMATVHVAIGRALKARKTS